MLCDTRISVEIVLGELERLGEDEPASLLFLYGRESSCFAWWAYGQPKVDLFPSAKPAKTATVLLSAFLPCSAERSVGIDPFNPAFREKVMGLTRKTIVSNRWIKCYRLTVIDEFPLRRRQWRDNLLPATTGARVCANRVLHTYIERPRLQLIREVLNERRTQTINSISTHFLTVKDVKSE